MESPISRREHVTLLATALAFATLGAVLKMDPKSERFIDNPEANQMLTREYRQPFVVPEKV